MSQTTTTTGHAEAASTLAVVVSSHEPLLFLSEDQTIIAASASFCRAFDIDPATVTGTRLGALGQGEWAMPELALLLEETASGDAGPEAREIDLTRPGRPTRRLALDARRLEDGDPGRLRLLLSVTDITDRRAEARLTADLVRDQAMQLQEAQHRIANSLQIIASVLMQSARRAGSEEARAHIHNAHHRVMSIATLQRQLSATGSGDVELRPYLTQLVRSLGASMIAQPGRLSIAVTVDDGSVDADMSVSLGLIVTELVINALKHAFPDDRPGTITIDHRLSDGGWTLAIADDGVGMAGGGEDVKAGLGTGIVAALVRKLKADMVVRDAGPGTIVTIRHRDGPGAAGGAP